MATEHKAIEKAMKEKKAAQKAYKKDQAEEKKMQAEETRDLKKLVSQKGGERDNLTTLPPPSNEPPTGSIVIHTPRRRVPLAADHSRSRWLFR